MIGIWGLTLIVFNVVVMFWSNYVGKKSNVFTMIGLFGGIMMVTQFVAENAK